MFRDIILPKNINENNFVRFSIDSLLDTNEIKIISSYLIEECQEIVQKIIERYDLMNDYKKSVDIEN